HPFLKIYFDDIGLLTEDDLANEFRNEYAQQQAIALLHYLATGQTNAPEYDLVLPKLLCGWPLNEPVASDLQLPSSAFAEGEKLLEAVINYWDALKNTTADGLREGFIQRQGKLTYTDDWKLRVEQQAIDILLSRLPWGISMVKLPWMPTVLVVEWT
ncbi:MAG: contractile injection system tape measure protein, partial [Phormidesmis sp.]